VDSNSRQVAIVGGALLLFEGTYFVGIKSE
jgi:hypothetical protein